MSMECPRCKVLLDKNELGHICSYCDGCWLTFKELERVLSFTTGRLVNSPLGRTLQPDHKDVNLEADADCPVCKNRMRRFPYMQSSDVIVDVCKTHGMWLDDGELTEIRNYLEDAGETFPDEIVTESKVGFFRRLLGRFL